MRFLSIGIVTSVCSWRIGYPQGKNLSAAAMRASVATDPPLRFPSEHVSGGARSREMFCNWMRSSTVTAPATRQAPTQGSGVGVGVGACFRHGERLTPDAVIRTPERDGGDGARSEDGRDADRPVVCRL